MIVNKYSQGRANHSCSHGFPGSTDWDEMADILRERGQFIWFRELEKDLGNGRVLVRDGGDMLMLSGYSYLGLNGRPEIRESINKAIVDFGSGSYGSRWLAGHTSLHEELESLLSEIHKREDTVLFSSGYVANVATISSLLSRNDTVLSDRLNHASILDGCRFAKSRFVRFNHMDCDHLEDLLSKAKGRKLVIVDAVYSMSGEISPIRDIGLICNNHDAALFVDECHSHFVIGPRGGGICDYSGIEKDAIDIEMGTLSKVIPSTGGYISSSSDICTYLRRSARGFIYSGSQSPAIISASIAALKIIKYEMTELLSSLNSNKEAFCSALRENGVAHGNHSSPIVPIHVGSAMEAVVAAGCCHKQGVFIHPVLPPVVPKGKSILRVGLMSNHRAEELRQAASIIATALEEARQRVKKSEVEMM